MKLPFFTTFFLIFQTEKASLNAEVSVLNHSKKKKKQKLTRYTLMKYTTRTFIGYEKEYFNVYIHAIIKI